jgi:uncharacterized protein YecT (DUF1311 family)
MSSNEEMTERELITRREAVLRVTILLGGAALVGGEALLTACTEKPKGEKAAAGAQFTDNDVAFLDEVADTILPTTSTPGAKAAKTGAFMTVMVRDSYSPRDQQIFIDGMRKVDDATQKAYSVTFMKATPQQRLAVLEALDKEQKAFMDARDEEQRKKDEAEKVLADQRKEKALGADVGAATAVTEKPEKPPAHYFRMMKELALLGYFTSEIGCTQAQRYVESPGRYDPCVPYTPGEKSWAPHA